DSLPARLADRTVVIGPARAADSYLKVEAVVKAALETGCDALHPGYGFLAEDPALAEACARAGITFVGPRAETIRELGNKVIARSRAVRAGIPVVPGSDAVKSGEEAEAVAREIGLPVLLK